MQQQKKTGILTLVPAATTGRSHFFSKLVESRSGYVKFGDNSRLNIHGRGDLEILCKLGQPLTLHNVLFVPDLEPNILSLGRLDDEDFKIVIEHGYMSIYDPPRDLVAKVKKTNGHLYQIKLKILDACMADLEVNSESRLWHKRFGHINFLSLRNLQGGS